MVLSLVLLSERNDCAIQLNINNSLSMVMHEENNGSVDCFFLCLSCVRMRGA